MQSQLVNTFTYMSGISQQPSLTRISADCTLVDWSVVSFLNHRWNGLRPCFVMYSLTRYISHIRVMLL